MSGDKLDAARALLERHGFAPLPLYGVGPDGRTCHCPRGARCTSAGKHPIQANWTSAPKPTLDDLDDLWRRYPTANVGIRTGAISGVFVADVDLWEAWAALIEQHGEPITLTIRTGSGGVHYYFLLPAGVKITNSRGSLPAGIDVRGDGGQVVAPPSRTGKGDYTIIRAMAPQPAPQWLLDMITAGRPASATAAAPVVAADVTEAQAAWHTEYAQDVIETRLCELDGLAALPWEDRPAGWDEATHAAACRILDLLQTPGVGLDPETVKADFLARAPRDEQWQDGPDRKWSAALRSVSGDGTVIPRKRATLDDLAPAEAKSTAPQRAAVPPAKPVTLDEARAVFRRWLGQEYDLDALHAMLATAAVERLDGDPVWLLIISGSGNAKTETVQALDGIGATVSSTISSTGALLSATSKRERSSDATGGLLRKLGASGVLVIKDVTSILSMSRDARGEVLGAFREVYDGRWTREVGTDGGRTLEWVGRLAVVGAVTTAWDTAHSVIAAMGDRFVLLRMDSTTGRQAAGRQAIGNVSHEVEMRAALAAAVAGVLASINTGQSAAVDASEMDRLLAAADLVTLARTAVEFDYRGDVIDAHAPEMPTRFAKQLAQVVRGAVAVGMTRTEAMRLAIRCARDSMPPLRLAIVDDLAQHPDSTTADVRRRLGKPRSTVDRQLQALHMLGLLDVDEVETTYAQKAVTRWIYKLAAGLDPSSISTDRPAELPVLAEGVHRGHALPGEKPPQTPESADSLSMGLGGKAVSGHLPASQPPSPHEAAYGTAPSCRRCGRLFGHMPDCIEAGAQQ